MHPLCDVQKIGPIAALDFSRRPPGKPDLRQRTMHSLPVDIAFADILPVESSPRAIHLEVLEVQTDDAGAERANPVLRIAIQHHVADVEIRPQVLRLEIIDVADELERAEKELVPDLLDRNRHLEAGSYLEQL